MKLTRWLVRYRRLPRRHRVRWDNPPQTWRDWQGWVPVFWIILLLVAVAVLHVSCRG